MLHNMFQKVGEQKYDIKYLNSNLHTKHSYLNQMK